MKDLSKTLCEVLDNLGFTSEFREWCLEVADTQDMLTDVMAAYHAQNVGYCLSRCAGSIVDGTFRASLNSDRDQLLIIQTEKIGDSDDNTAPYHMVYENNYIGYVKIRASSNKSSTTKVLNIFKHEDDGTENLLLTNELNDANPMKESRLILAKTGPAHSIPAQKRVIGCDFVFAYECNSWPKIAHKWFCRQRRYNWPPKKTVEEFRTMPCYVVATGHPHSTTDHHLLWRLSFSRQERHLMTNLTDVQYKCYVILKMIKEEIITPTVGKSLTSYHCKTSLFYTIEENDQDIWRPGELLECVRKCLQQLLSWTKEDFCPNYFLPKSNLFAGKVEGNTISKLKSVLNELVQFLPTVISKMKCERISHWIQCINEKNELTRKKLINLVDRGLAKFVTCILKTLSSLITSIYSKCFFLTTSSGAVKEISKSIDVICAQYKRQHAHIRETLDLILGYLHTDLASHLVCLALQNNNPHHDWYIAAAINHFIRAMALEDTISRLKLANVLIVTGHRESAARVLECMDKRFGELETFAGLNGFVRPKINICNELLHRGVRQLFDIPVSQALKHFTCGPVVFLPSEIFVTPAALVFEMFRTIATPFSQGNLEFAYFDNYNYLAAVDAEVFYHLLKYQSGIYLDFGDFDSHVRSILYSDPLGTSCNVTSWVAMHSGNFRESALACKMSFQAELRHLEEHRFTYKVNAMQYGCNAAKLHIWMLVYKIWKDGQLH